VLPVRSADNAALALALTSDILGEVDAYELFADERGRNARQCQGHPRAADAVVDGTA